MVQQDESLHLLRTFRRGWKIIAVVLILTTGAAAVISILLPVQWKATAVLTVEPLAAAPLPSGSGGSVSVNMNTESVVARSTEVLSRAAEELDGPSVAEMSNSLNVSVPKGSQVLEFTYTTGSPSLAPEAANALALAYNRQRVESAEQIIAETTDSLVERVVEIGQKRDATREGTPEYETLSLQISTLQERQASLTATTFYPGTLVSPAVTPVQPANLSLKIFLVAGAFLGLILGFAVALGYDKFVEFRSQIRPAGKDEDDQDGPEKPVDEDSNTVAAKEDESLTTAEGKASHVASVPKAPSRFPLSAAPLDRGSGIDSSELTRRNHLNAPRIARKFRGTG